MKHTKTTIFAATIFAAIMPTVAYAHTGVGTASGFHSGFLHPFIGLDHMLAMVAVGLWAVQLGGKAIWAMPATFIFIMAIGGLAGMNGIQLPMTEQLILLSIFTLGTAVATAFKTKLTFLLPVVGLFAMFHGLAHGAEVPVTASSIPYIAGFVVATIAIHSIGITAGLLLRQASASHVIRFAGASIAASCLLFIAL